MPITSKFSQPAVTQLHAGQERAIRDFLRRHYGEGFYGADEAYFNWLFLKSPCEWFLPQRDRGRLPANAVLMDDGGIGALHTYVPFDAVTPWGGRIGIWDLDWINGSGIRGAGRALAEHLLRSVDIYAGFGCNDLSENAFKRMGMDVVAEEIPRCVVMLDRETLLGLLSAEGIKQVEGSLPADQPSRTDSWFELESVTAIRESLLHANQSPTGLSVTRSRQWLEWRYRDHPYIEYRVIAADAHGDEGVAIVRIENIVTTGKHVCRILDLFPAQNRDGKLLGAVVAFAQTSGCLLIDYFSASTMVANRWRTAGADVKIAVALNPRIPFMFQPLAISERNSINMVLSRGGRIPPGEPVDLALFHATKADANQDILRSPETAAKLVRRK